jgi:hypothetical protein
MESTIPFIKDVLESGLSAWELEHALGRVLRGNGGSGSPGFVEDAITFGMMSRDEIGYLIEGFVKNSKMKKEITIDVLSQYCRHYVGMEKR